MLSEHSTPTLAGDEPIWPGFPARSLAFADPLDGGTAIENASGRHQLVHAGVPEVESLHRVLAAVSTCVDPPSAVRAALHEALAVTGATAGSLWIFQPDGSIARAAHAGLTREYLSTFAGTPDWPRVQRDIGRVADVTVHDDGDLPWLPEHHRSMTPLLGLRTMAVVPLRTRGQRMGSMVLGHPQPGWFRGHSLEFLRTLGELVAVALDNARLLAEVRADGTHARDPNGLVERMLGLLDVGVALVSSGSLEVLDHNPAFARLLVPGGAGPALRGPLRELVPEGEASALVSATRRAAAEARRVVLPELELRWTDREPTFWDVAVAPLRAGADEIDSPLVIMLTDVTERRALEDRYRHAQKMEAVGTLAGGIAHEFNNLLTAILGQVSLALFDLPKDHPLVPGLKDCETAALRAADLTRQLLGFGRRSPVRLRPTDLREVVDQALPLFQHAIDPRILIERDDAPDLWSVHADGAQLGQALMNLCVNARDAMPSGGRLVIRLRNARIESAVAPRRGDFVVLEVADSGAGMPPDVQARVFEPFFTTKGPDRGTGLGLSVVHGIVEQHGGWVDCDSQPGAGTTFRIHLPRIGASSPALAAPAGSGETVLVVDDEDALRTLSRSILERLGYRVLLASDGAEAVRVFREQHERIDLVLLDMTMPRLSGRDALEQLREISPGARIVFTSGYELGQGSSAGEAAVADGFLAKPYSPEQVASVVRAALDSRR